MRFYHHAMPFERAALRELDFLARFCACCDLVSIQEVQDNLDGLRQPRVNRAINVAFAVLLVASVALALLF